MDFLSFFVFRTAFPFGYLILLGLPLLGAIVWGVVLLARDVRRYRGDGQVRMSWGLLILAGVALFIGVNVIYDRALDLNPQITPADLVGTWRRGRATLELHADGSYRCSGGGDCKPLGSEGRWTHDGSSQLDFLVGEGEFRAVTRRRVVRYAGVLRLTEAAGDPDMWDGVLTFAHRAPAS